MSLKLKLVSTISAFVLVLGLLFVGVWAANQGSVQMGGSLSFTATDVYARVTGEISGAGVGDKTLPAIEFSASNENPDQSGWQNLDLEFNAAGEPITIEVKVENLATDRSLTVNLKDNFSSEQGGLIKDVKNGDSEYTGSNVVLNASTGSGTSTTTFTITLSLSSKNNSLSDTTFGYTINLYDASYEFPAITGFTFLENNDGTAILTGYTGTDTEVVIPSSYSIKMVDGVKTYIEGNDYLVTTISSSAFSGRGGLTSIIIPDSVTAIYSSAFEGCSGLTSITIPDSVTTIYSSAFKGCSGLTSITIPDSVTTIGSRAFEGCSGLTSITIPEGVTTIGPDAFRDCSGLASVTFEENSQLTTIGSDAFRDCSGLTSITIPEGVTTIGSHAFYNCNGLETMNYLGTLESWCAIEFGGNNSNPTIYTQALYIQGEEIVGEVVVPEGIDTLANTFIGCENITSVSLPNSLTTIGSSAFEGCSGLTSVTIPAGVTTIGSSAFKGCSGLTSITIPESVTTIGSWAFNSCSGLTSIAIPEGVTSIGSSAFSSCRGLTSVDLSDCTRLTTIGEWAFSSCRGLTSVDLSGCTSLTTIGNYAFSSCSSLTSITLPSSLTSIGYGAFSSCSSLTSITIYATTPPTLGSSAIPSNVANIYVPAESVEAYKSGWSSYASKIFAIA